MAFPKSLLAFVFLIAGMLPIKPANSAELLAVGTEFAHVFERSPSGQFFGLGVDILNAMAKMTGDTIKFEIYPWSRAQWMVENGQAHILIGPYKTPDREARFSFAQRAFYRDFMMFYTRVGAEFNWNGDYAFLVGKKIGVVNGWVYGDQFEKMRGTMKLEVAHSLTSALKMLSAHRVDVLASNVRNTEVLVKSLGPKYEYVAVEPAIATLDGYLAFCKQVNCELVRKLFDEAFERLRESGELAKMGRKHNVRMPP